MELTSIRWDSGLSFVVSSAMMESLMEIEMEQAETESVCSQMQYCILTALLYKSEIKCYWCDVVLVIQAQHDPPPPDSSPLLLVGVILRRCSGPRRFGSTAIQCSVPLLALPKTANAQATLTMTGSTLTGPWLSLTRLTARIDSSWVSGGGRRIK